MIFDIVIALILFSVLPVVLYVAGVLLFYALALPIWFIDKLLHIFIRGAEYAHLKTRGDPS